LNARGQSPANIFRKSGPPRQRKFLHFLRQLSPDETGMRQLAARGGSFGETRRRAPSRRRPNALDQFIRMGVVATLAGYLAKRVKLVAIITVAAAALLTGWHLFGRSSAPALATNDAPAASERTLPLPPVRSVAVEPALHVPPAPSGSARPDAIASLLARGAGAPSNSAPAQLAPRDPTLDAWFVKAYLRCWSPPTNLPQGEKYAAQVRVIHNNDGSISSPPVLVNPPSDPEWRPFADSAVRAVTKCSPLQVPPQYAARFDQWKKLSLHFSPDAAVD
jgi:hypothetical protein